MFFYDVTPWGIEPQLPGWKPEVLTARRWGRLDCALVCSFDLEPSDILEMKYLWTLQITNDGYDIKSIRFLVVVFA